MPYDETTAARIRRAFGRGAKPVERKMFGGLTFMHRGHMCCGVTGDGELMVRVGEPQAEKLARRKHARPCDFTGRPMKGMLLIEAPGFRSEAALREWVSAAKRHAASLPAKKGKA